MTANQVSVETSDGPAQPRAVDRPVAVPGEPAALLSVRYGQADLLARSPIRGDLQAHLAVAGLA